MSYSSLLLRQFRSYRKSDFEFSPGVNIIVGPNGSGKTNLLEALYILSHGSSYRVNDKDLLQYGRQQFKLEGRYLDTQRLLSYNLAVTPVKQFIINKVNKQRLTAETRVPLVLFEPNELRLLNSSPTRRRDYLDSLSSRLWLTAGRIRRKYERALQQRNDLIKNAFEGGLGSQEDLLFVWDVKLSEYAADLVRVRLKLIDSLNANLSNMYSNLADKSSQVEVVYKSEIDINDYQADLIKQLNQRRKLDFRRGFTSVGPHRDDFFVLLNDVDVAVSASRGEIRTLVLAIKLIELQLLSNLNKQRPILLMDDVFSELDVSRRHALALTAKDYQTIITTTDADHITEHFPNQYKIIRL